MAIAQFGECIDNQQFIRSTANFEFPAAVQFCEDQEEGKVVTFTNAAEFQAFNDFTQENVWVGIIDDRTNGDGLTSRFEIIGESNRDFINTGVEGAFPWLDGQPNGIDNDENCVRARDGRIADVRCDAQRQVVCQISGCQPTVNPTTEPTKNPTQNPTKTPTRNPTKNPTTNPTENPTETPTNNPTINPTVSKAPTSSPTSIQEVSECFKDIFEYVLVTPSVTTTFTLIEAISVCNLETPGMTLASITNTEAARFVSDFLESNELFNEAVYFGLTRSPAVNLPNVEDFTDPSLFTFIDGTEFDDEVRSFAQIRGQPPWSASEPDSTVVDDQPCAVLLNGRWNDVSCDFQAKFSLCRRECTLEAELEVDENEINVVVPIVAVVQVFVIIALVAAIFQHVKKMKSLAKIHEKEKDDEFIRLD